jgi:cytoskeletal protein CcmA (bactofilin family)
VHGDIRAHEVECGTVIGTIVADERVEIQGTSSVQGDIHTKSIVVLEGGVINGTVRMGEIAGQATRELRDGAADSPLRPGLALRQ